MISFKGYVYESTGPDMPIIAVIFDSEDTPIQIRVVATASLGMQFLADSITDGSGCRELLARRKHRTSR